MLSDVDIFVAIFLVVCYEMNFSSVSVDLKLDFDQLYFFTLKFIYNHLQQERNLANFDSSERSVDGSS